MNAPGAEQLTPLRMAQNCLSAVQAVADWQERDPTAAAVYEAGKMGKQSAELAACCALVSIAESLATIATALEGSEQSADRIATALEHGGGAADV